MIIKINELKNNNIYKYQEDLVFEEDVLKRIDLIKKVNTLKASLELKVCHPFIVASLKLDGDLILLSSRSLKEVPYEFSDESSLTFSLEQENEDDEVIYIQEPEIDFDTYFYYLLNENIPYQIIAEGEDDNLSGDSWELIQEDEYNKRKNDNDNPFFDALKDFDDED